jgi:hypothetical protein
MSAIICYISVHDNSLPQWPSAAAAAASFFAGSCCFTSVLLLLLLLLLARNGLLQLLHKLLQILVQLRCRAAK